VVKNEVCHGPACFLDGYASLLRESGKYLFHGHVPELFPLEHFFQPGVLLGADNAHGSQQDGAFRGRSGLIVKCLQLF
jgi:hypothetical protein